MEDVVKEVKQDLRREIRELLVQKLSGKPGVGDRRTFDGVREERRTEHREDGDVARYLKEQGYDYALSVFMAEAKLGPESLTRKTLKPAAAAGSSKTVWPEERKEIVAEPVNVDLRAIAEQLWTRLEKKYRSKMRQQAKRRKEELREKIRILEERFEAALLQKEQELSDEFLERTEQLNRKEQDALNQLSRDKLNQEKMFQGKRQELMFQVKELENRRDQLQQLEEEFQRHTAHEEGRLRSEREQVSLRELAVKRGQLELNQRLEAVREQTRAEEEERTTGREREGRERERAWEAEVGRLRDQLREASRLKGIAADRGDRVKELEGQLQALTSELDAERARSEGLKGKLLQFSDYDKTKKDLQRARLELESLHAQDAGLKKARSLEQELKSLKEQREMDLKAAAFKEEEWRMKSDAEKARNADLVNHFKAQGIQIRDLNRELTRLRIRLENSPPAPSATGKSGRKKAVATRFELNGNSKSVNSESEEVSVESTPDYVKEARARMRKLDAESESLNESIRLYQKLQEAKTGQKISFDIPGAVTGPSDMIKYARIPPNSADYDQSENAVTPDSSRIASPPLIPLASTPKSPVSRIPMKKADAEKERRTWFAKNKNDTSLSPVEMDRPERKPSPRTEKKAPIAAAAVRTFKEEPEHPPPPKEATKDSAEEDEWEARLKRRAEERRREEERERERAQREMEDLRREEERKEQREKERRERERAAARQEKESPKAKPPEERREEPADPDDGIDPEMKKYMALVMSQRAKEQQQEPQPRKEVQPEDVEVEDPEVEIAQMSQPSDSDGW